MRWAASYRMNRCPRERERPAQRGRKMNKRRDQVWVWLDDPNFGPLQHIGTLSRGAKGSISFAYQKDWLQGRDNFSLDPELDMYAGEFYPRDSNFGVFMDSCPDRWGQVLMKRRETLEAK